MGRETVLLYCMENEKEQAVRHVCLQLGIKVKTVRPEQYQLPIGMLLLMKVCTQATERKYAGNVFSGRPPLAENVLEISEEMMVMDGFSAASMDRFLDRMKKNGISGIALKAVLTEFNRNWSSVQLYHELKDERAKFQ